MPPRRSARTSTASASTKAPVSTRTTAAAPPRRTKRVVSPTPSASDDELAGGLEDEEDEQVPATLKKSASRQAVAMVGRGKPPKAIAKPVAATGRRRSTRISSAASISSNASEMESADGDTTAKSVLEEDEDEEEVEVNEEEEEEEEEVIAAPKARGRRVVSGAKNQTKAGKAKKIVHSEEDEEEEPIEGGEPSSQHGAAMPPNASEALADMTDNEKTPAPPRAVSGAVRQPISPINGEDDEPAEDAMLAPAPISETQVPIEMKGRPPIPRLRLDTDSEMDVEEAERTIRLDSTSGSPPPLVNIPPPTPGRTPSASRLGPPPTPGPSQNQSQPQPSAKPKPRLTIHKLVLVNFKSYAGRQEIGPFHKSFSAIVGPNGSGKSNTIDALLFVFGYRASKMRQGKLSELIHNSAGKEGLESCSVEVWFREIVDLPGVNDFLLVPNSQLVVTRTAYRNNSSKYTINDRTSSFGEVTALLKGKGIDLDHNRFLILQGEVESIAQMKAKAQNEHEDGLLEYLEDIIGTTRYKEPIEQANAEVETLNEERGEKMNRLRVVEREKAALEEKKQEAEGFLRDSNELTRKKSLLWQFHMYTLQNNLDITSSAIQSLTAQLAEEQQKNAGHLTEIDDLQKGYDEKLAAFEDVKRLTDALVKDSKKFEKEEVGLQEKKKHLSTKQKKLKKTIAEDGHARSEAQATIDNLTSELEANRNKVTTLETKLAAEEAELEEVRDSLKDKTDEFTDKIEVKQRELEPWTAKISEKQSAIDVAQSERDMLVEKASSAAAALDEARRNLESLRKGDGSKHEEYEELKKEAVKVKKALAGGEQGIESMTAQGEQLRAKLSSARQKMDDARASLAEDKSENAVLSGLNKLKDQGRIKGFHGRLGDLGVIDDKYDVAVTTACGALNNLVVDTVEQGQACIEHLRKGNIGRASFMVLEKLPPRDLSRIETPENVPRLFDLIKPKDPRFAPAFFKGVSNTLVAEDLAQAQRIGYGKKRWRVVTLAGQLIDPSGTMSGGGNKVSRGGMSSKFTADKVAPEVVARYEREFAAAEQELAAFQGGRKSAEAELNGFRRRLPEIEIAMEKIELDVQTATKRIAEAEKRLKELQSDSEPDAADEARVKILDKQIASLTGEADKLREEAAVIQSQIKDLQEKIMEVGGVRLRSCQSKVSTTKGLLDLANESITKAEVGQTKAERDIVKLAKALEANGTKLAEADGELEVVERDLQACTADLTVLREKVQEAQDASTDVQEDLAQSKTELDEKLADINAFRKLEMDIKQKIEDSQRVQKDSSDKLKHWKKRHAELELAYIDEEDEDEEEEPVEDPARQASVDGGPAGEDERPAPKQKREKESHELAEYSPDELRAVDKEMLNAEITQLEEEIGKAKPNLTVLAEYRRREAEFLDRARDMEAVTSQRDAAKKRYDDLRKVRLDEFMAGFSAISIKLKEMYQMITMGGNAEIELIDSMDPFSEGVVLSIMPPKKSWRAIANLSGGEKTLASLALVFALHVFKPTPLYFMDEIDAALDFKNVSIVANYIQSKTQAAQFIVISLRNDMFELAHRLVGIYKTSNCTKSIAIDNKDLTTQAVPRRDPAMSPSKRIARSPLPGAPGTARKLPPGTPMTLSATSLSEATPRVGA
ncbi:RecF/RecN/SMC N terminal domain-domain-containing protein [Kockovaella imperatae]|uniref:Structural maintenance of chromosomes protein 4 n=1 Tax=Kockovaella imperatae TaxID=4999 RepID=A0A1Y1ULH9_9TREE|nr:RecF/RecN/SMC N terminal domain-domain-containing protein [Kockovaella imperatae]ORX37975.1 RecF/RecN/SMC N terminal domain-domain-containing protein [Kockovaella imperatae]